MEKNNLNNKSWYRALKVIFIILFLMAQGIGFAVTSEIADDTKGMIVCDNGKKFETTNYYLTDEQKLAEYKLCDITSFFLSKSDVKGVLTADQMADLKSQIDQMQAKGALLSDMQSFVNSYKQANAETSPDTTAQKTYTPEELSKVWGHDVTDSFSVQGRTDKWVSNFTLTSEPKHTTAEKVLYYVLSFLIVSLIFWIISRIFFYVFAKEPFIKISRK